MRINLRKMHDNQAGTIASVKVAGELGRRAPLYDPVALRVMGATLTLRNNEADYIEVEIE
jgi:ferrous iron transport protein A